MPPEASCDKNLTGLIANVLMDKYKRPTLLLNKVVNDDNTVWWMGSGRGYSKCKLTDFRSFLEDMNLFTEGGFAQGHAQAFGFAIPADKLDILIQQSEEKLKDFDFTPTYKVDKIFTKIKANDYADLEEICVLDKIWGQGVEEPKFAFENISPLKVTLMSPDKNPTLKISLPNGVDCIKFKSSEEEYKSLQAP